MARRGEARSRGPGQASGQPHEDNAAPRPRTANRVAPWSYLSSTPVPGDGARRRTRVRWWPPSTSTSVMPVRRPRRRLARAAREEIDALNVYPVPDGDTGTNMYLTVEAARDAMRDALAEPARRPPGGDAAPTAAGALLGARGNSGVILSQLVGALLRRIGQAGPEDRSAAVFAEGMALATDAAYAAVGRPVEGTILSVARAAAEAAARGRGRPGQHAWAAVVHAAAQAAREALARTPEQLPAAGPGRGGRRGRTRALRGPRRGRVGDHRPARGSRRRRTSAAPRSRWRGSPPTT